MTCNQLSFVHTTDRSRVPFSSFLAGFLRSAGLCIVFASFATASHALVATDKLSDCVSATQQSLPLSPSCATALADMLDQAHVSYVAGQSLTALAYLHQAARIEPNDLRLSYEQALVDDAQGHHALARTAYDALKGTPLANLAAVPSAVNLVLLMRYDDARVAFASLHGHGDGYLNAYTALWRRWLDARQAAGPSSAAGHGDVTRHVAGAAAYQQALLDLYAGRATVEDVFAAVDALPPNTLAQSDARTEAAFFVGGYLQYVKRDANAARELYRRELPRDAASVERPLIEQALATP